MQDIWVSLHSIHLKSTHLSRCCWVSSYTGHHRLEASLRSARLQGLPKVGPARLLAAMLGDLGVSTLRSIKTITQLSSLLSIIPAMLFASMLGDYSTSASSTPSCFSSSYRPVGKPVSHHVVTRPTLFPLILFWTIIPAILPATMLGYYS
jgi:hypothetical protein